MMMTIKKIVTDEISMDEWKRKLATDDNAWLIRQYYGLDFLVKSMDTMIENIYHKIRDNIGGSLGNEYYKDNIYPLESEMMDMNCQLVSVEEEMELRGLSGLILEGDC